MSDRNLSTIAIISTLIDFYLPELWGKTFFNIFPSYTSFNNESNDNINILEPISKNFLFMHPYIQHYGNKVYYTLFSLTRDVFSLGPKLKLFLWKHQNLNFDLPKPIENNFFQNFSVYHIKALWLELYS